MSIKPAFPPSSRRGRIANVIAKGGHNMDWWSVAGYAVVAAVPVFAALYYFVWRKNRNDAP